MGKVKAILILTGTISSLRDTLTEYENKRFDELKRKSPTFLTESELKDLEDFKLRTRGGRELGQRRLNMEINIPPIDQEKLNKRIDQVVRILQTGMLPAQKKAPFTPTVPAAPIPEPADPKAPTVEATIQPTDNVDTGSVELSGLPDGSWNINPGSHTGSGKVHTISDLVPGTYNFTVTNAEGRTSAATSDIVIVAYPEEVLPPPEEI